jgi:hypothetical protein
MEILKVALVVATGLGSTWAAGVVTDAAFGGPRPQALVQDAGRQEPATPPPAAGDGQAPAVPEMSREEMEAELRRAQAELGAGSKGEELREFRPTKPLPADLPVALPSDI